MINILKKKIKFLREKEQKKNQPFFIMNVLLWKISQFIRPGSFNSLACFDSKKQKKKN